MKCGKWMASQQMLAWIIIGGITPVALLNVIRKCLAAFIFCLVHNTRSSHASCKVLKGTVFLVKFPIHGKFGKWNFDKAILQMLLTAPLYFRNIWHCINAMLISIITNYWIQCLSYMLSVSTIHSFKLIPHPHTLFALAVVSCALGF